MRVIVTTVPVLTKKSFIRLSLVLLPGKSHGWRSLVGCSLWGQEELDMTDRLHFHFSRLCIGEGNGNPLQCSCLENPRDGVAQSQTWLKWLSSSSSMYIWTSLVAQTIKNLPAMWESWVQSLGWEDSLEEGMATHSGILAWRISWTEDPGGLQFTGSQRIRHN